MFVYWISCHLVFFFESMNCCKKEKKYGNSSECFTHGLGKTIRVFNQALSKMSWATKLKFSLTIYFIIQVTKMKRNKSQLYRETNWVITTVCHWSTCKCNNMQTCFLGIDLQAYSKLHGQFSFDKTTEPSTKASGKEVLL